MSTTIARCARETYCSRPSGCLTLKSTRPPLRVRVCRSAGSLSLLAVRHGNKIHFHLFEMTPITTVTTTTTAHGTETQKHSGGDCTTILEPSYWPKCRILGRFPGHPCSKRGARPLLFSLAPSPGRVSRSDRRAPCRGQRSVAIEGLDVLIRSSEWLVMIWPLERISDVFPVVQSESRRLFVSCMELVTI